MEQFGIVGLPNAGKSALFNALTGGSAAVAPHPFSTTETNIGVATVPDPRVDALAVMSASRKIVHATAEFVDIAGLQRGASEGEGLGNRFLGGIREVDAILYVLRAFVDDNVVGGTDPLDDLHTLEFELTLADLASAEQQLERRRKAAKGDKSLAGEVAVLEWAVSTLVRGNAAVSRRPHRRPARRAASVLPVDDEAGARGGEPRRGPARRCCTWSTRSRRELGDVAEVLGVSVQLEAEAAQLPADERAELLDGLGLGEGALPRVARAAYHLLGLRTFLTTGDKESRAWTFRAGAKAPECAGVIHSDLQRGFIRAEVIHWDELLELGSWNKAKEVGKLRIEGKDYEVADGDVLEIRFNV